MIAIFVRGFLILSIMESTEAEKLITHQDESAESDDTIVQNIFASRVERADEGSVGISAVVLRYGRKDMTIMFRRGIHLSGGLLVNIHLENARGEPAAQKNETTFLYMAAEKVLQEFADQSGQSVSYVFDTESTALADWARTRGEALFHWDKEDIDDKKPEHVVFTKFFKPKQHE